MLPCTTIRSSDAAYPGRLRSLELQPAQLWLRGVWDDQRPCLAVVGSRAATHVGMALAQRLSTELGRAGVSIISGGAIGIDAAAHRGALRGGAPTCAVLGTGVDVVYPQRNGPLYDDILARGGCLLSLFPLGTPPKPWHFPARNRVIAALADAVLVVEAQPGSGSLYTAQAARKLGRPVLVVPGSPGAGDLLREGALPVGRAAEILAALGLPAPVEEMSLEDEPPLNLFGRVDSSDWEHDWPAPVPEGEVALVRHALDRTPRDLSELSVRAGVTTAICAAVVVDLELRGQCTRLAGGRYVAQGASALPTTVER